jgi:hypothetical protein
MREGKIAPLIIEIKRVRKMKGYKKASYDMTEQVMKPINLFEKCISKAYFTQRNKIHKSSSINNELILESVFENRIKSILQKLM